MAHLLLGAASHTLPACANPQCVCSGVWGGRREKALGLAFVVLPACVLNILLEHVLNGAKIGNMGLPKGTGLSHGQGKGCSHELSAQNPLQAIFSKLLIQVDPLQCSPRNTSTPSHSNLLLKILTCSSQNITLIESGFCLAGSQSPSHQHLKTRHTSLKM